MAHQEQDPKNLLIVAIGLGSVVTLTGVMFGLYSYYQNLRDDWQHQRIGALANTELVEMQRANRCRLGTALPTDDCKQVSSYAYTDASRKTARIPVGDAMNLLAQRGRDAFPSIQPAAAATAPGPAGAGAAPAMSGAAPGGSATPATSGSAAPGGSAAPANSAHPGDKKDHK